jgi:hypothetical protein
MSANDVTNESGYAYDALLTFDEAGVPVFAPLVQATCAILDDGRVGLLKKQPPVNVAGEWYGDPATTSLKLEPQIAFTKLATDVVLLGHAYSEKNNRSESQVGIRVGPVQKLARVFGDRRLVKRPTGLALTRPEPFEKLPLLYERSFGGWDRRHQDERRHRSEARNPVGRAFRDTALAADDELLLPNFEDPRQPFRAYGDVPAPVGFGFIHPAWQPRAGYAGTYDEAWDKSRKPLLPTDFDRRFFNAASPGLIAQGYLQGNEPVTVIGASPEGRVDFEMPGLAPPRCLVDVRGGKPEMLQTALDTVIVDMDARTLTLMWRACMRLRSGPHDIVSVEVDPPDPSPDSIEEE